MIAALTILFAFFAGICMSDMETKREFGIGMFWLLLAVAVAIWGAFL